MKRLLLRISGVVAALIVFGVAGLYLDARDAIGGHLGGARLGRAERSPEWRDGRFTNRLERKDGPLLEAARKSAFGGSPDRKPRAPVPVVARTRKDYDAPPTTGLRVTWFGHSTALVEIDGQRVLIDPVWSEHASPFGFAGPKQFFPIPLPFSELPHVDAVIISHDHYDHLDMPTIKSLSALGARFFVPLGIGAHLEAWGVPLDHITELDWWQSADVNGLTLTSVPARHFSGRLTPFGNSALWTGWSMASAKHRVYYSGDTALDDAMVEIGNRLGPFDLTMIEIGQYDALWSDVHLGPEQAVRVHQLVHGKVMLPMHWARFDLALHSWTEPIERTVVAAAAHGVPLLTPRPGEMVEPELPIATTRWWPALPWQTVAEAPAWSTGVALLMSGIRP